MNRPKPSSVVYRTLSACAVWVAIASAPAQEQRPAPAQPAADAAQTRVVALEHASASNLESVLRNFLREDHQAARQVASSTRPPARPAVVVAFDATNSLVVSAGADQMQELLELIARLDVPPPDAAEARGLPSSRSRLLQLRHAQANELAQVLQHFLDQSRRATQQQPRAPVISAHTDSNTLLISATEQQLAELAAMVEQLDRPSARPDTARRARPRYLQGVPREAAALTDPGADVVELLELEHLAARVCAQDVNALLGDTGVQARAVGEDAAIALRGPAEAVRGAALLIRRAEESAARHHRGSTAELVRLEHGDATELAAALRTTMPPPGNRFDAFRCAIAGPKRLMLRGEPGTVAQARELVRALDVAD